MSVCTDPNHYLVLSQKITIVSMITFFKFMSLHPLMIQTRAFLAILAVANAVLAGLIGLQYITNDPVYGGNVSSSLVDRLVGLGDLLVDGTS